MGLLRILLVIVCVVGAAISAKPSYAGEDTTPPVCAITGTSPETFYPREDGYRDRARITFDVSDDSAPFDVNYQLMVLIPDAGGALAYTGPVVTVPNPSFGLELYWDGRDDLGALVPEGPYDLMVHTTDGNGNVEDCHQLFTVDHAKLVKKTFDKTVKAGPSMLDKGVGECSKLAKGVRGWEGSLGYYSNTRCERDPGPGDEIPPSVVLSINGILVPDAFDNRYHDLTVKLYGGAARSRPISKGILQYVKRLADEAAALAEVGSRIGTHAGKTVGAKPFIRRDDFDQPYVAWAMLTANGHRYDVKSFTVVLKYTALVDQNERPVVPSGRPMTPPLRLA